MPQAAVTVIAGWLVAAGATAAVATFAAQVFVYAATSYLLGRASKALTPKRRGAGLGTGTEINYFDTGAAVRIVYGQVKTGGMETIPPTTTSKDNSNAFEDLHKVLTLAGHEIDSYNTTHFDTTEIPNSATAAMAYTTSDGMVTAGVYSGHAFIRKYRGTSTDSADRILTRISSTQFGNSRARGIAKVAVTLRYHADVYAAVPLLTFTYQGKRCYDPRLDSSPGAAPTNPSFIAWTQCPALCLADYLMSDLGGSYPAADVDWDTVVTAANYCDALVNLPGAVTQKRYTCNGVLFANEEFTDNVKALADSMLGRVIFRDGKWRMFAGSWQTPTFTVLKEDWISGLSIRFEQGKKKRFNQMRTWFIDAARDWQRVESTPRTNATFRTADGGETLDAETEQLMCTNEYETQRKGEFLLRQSRNQITVAGRLPPRFQNIALWDTGTIVFDHLGWSSKTFRVVGIDMNPDGSMDCVFSEEQSGDWTDLDAADYSSPSDSTLPAQNATSPTEPTSLTATPQVNGTILFDWGRPIVQPSGTEFRIIRSTNSANAAVGTTVWQGVARPVPLVMPMSAHWYYVQAVANSVLSPFQPNTFGVLAIPRLEADQTLQNRLAGDAEFSFGDASSLWQSGNIFSVVSGFVPGIERFNNVSSLASTSYSPTGGQYGGYLNFQKRAGVTHTQGQDYPAFFTVNPANPIGYPANLAPFAVQYTMRFRINSRPNGTIGGEQFGVAISQRFSTPNSPFPSNATILGGIASVRSADAVLGQWTYLQRTKVVEPLDLNANSASQIHVVGCVYSNCTSGINVDFDYLDVQPLGWLNNPVDVRTGGPLREFHSMYSSVPDFTCKFQFPQDGFGMTGDWWRFTPGRRFVINKLSTTSACFIEPSSGMTLRLAGRAAVGTVTMVQSLPASAVIENLTGIEFLVTGTGLV